MRRLLILGMMVLGLAVSPGSLRAELTFRECKGDATGINAIMAGWHAQEVSRTGNPTPPWWPWQVSVADFDKDGKPDILALLHHGKASKIFKGTGNDAAGNPQFAEYPGLNYLEWPYDDGPIILDYGNGWPSVFSWRDGSPSNSDFLNNGGVFTKRQPSTVSGARAAVYEVKDLNGDGKPDIVGFYPGYGKTTEKRRLNNGDGTFTAQNVPHARPAGLPATVVAELDAFAVDTSTVNRFCGPIFWEQDLNGDGRTDCLIRYFGGYADAAHIRGWVLVRGADNVLVDRTLDLGIKGMPYPAEDFTGDGRFDLYTSHAPGSGLWVQQGDGTFRNDNADISAFASARQDYPQRTWSVDLDGDGDRDFVANNSRGKAAEVYEQTAPGTFVKRMRLNVWDAHGIAVADVNGDGKPDLVCGGPGLSPWGPGGAMLDKQITLYLNDSTPPAPVHKIPVLPYDLASPAATRFLAMLDGAANGGTVPYGVTAWQLAQAFRMTGDERYAVVAHRLAKTRADAALAAIAAGGVPEWATNSYLNAGRVIEDLCCVLDWCPAFVTEEERLEWMTLAEQTVWNIWNHREAQWGGQSKPWNGWAVMNPGSNYHHGSFLPATMYWGMLASDSGWKERLRTLLLPAVISYFSGLPAGGSREGTGYGESQRTLFALMRTWKDATGQDIAADLPFVRSSLDYWSAAIQPGSEYIAPIGDLARDVSAKVYDYNRHLFLELARNDDPVARGRLAWLSTFYPQMRQPANYVWDLLASSPAEQLPPPMAYASPEVGDYFWKTGLDVDARMLTFRAGLYKEAHAHQDNGSIELWGKRKRLITRANVWSRDGLRQRTEYHSTLRFTAGGATIPQKYGAEPITKAWAGTEDRLTASANLSSFVPPILWSRHINAWKSTAEHPFGCLVVEDTCVLPAGATAIWQVQLSEHPVILSEQQVMTESLLITSKNPVAWEVLDWRTVTSPTSFSGGWRLSASGRSNYHMTIGVQ